MCDDVPSNVDIIHHFESTLLLLFVSVLLSGVLDTTLVIAVQNQSLRILANTLNYWSSILYNKRTEVSE